MNHATGANANPMGQQQLTQVQVYQGNNNQNNSGHLMAQNQGQHQSNFVQLSSGSGPGSNAMTTRGHVPAVMTKQAQEEEEDIFPMVISSTMKDLAETCGEHDLMKAANYPTKDFYFPKAVTRKLLDDGGPGGAPTCSLIVCHSGGAMHIQEICLRITDTARATYIYEKMKQLPTKLDLSEPKSTADHEKQLAQQSSDLKECLTSAVGDKLGKFGQEIQSRIFSVSNRLESLEKKQAQGNQSGQTMATGDSSSISGHSIASNTMTGSTSSNNVNEYHYHKISSRGEGGSNKRDAATAPTMKASSIGQQGLRSATSKHTQQYQPQRSPLTRVLGSVVADVKENIKNRKKNEEADISPRTKAQKNEEARKNFKAKQLKQEAEACDDLLHKAYTDTIENLTKNKARRNPQNNKAEDFDNTYEKETNTLRSKLACKKPAKPTTRRREAFLECLAERRESTTQLSATTVGAKIVEPLKTMVKNYTPESYIDDFRAKLKLRENDERSLFCLVATSSVLHELRRVQQAEKNAIEQAKRYARDGIHDDDDEFSPLGGSKKKEV
ncbi:unnamed protein product [Amoebophrya sp. A25]|nr:unnamed protein product [Amoebophrya sp. A25]|eukprot:GSA25T00027181001.1